VVPASIHEFFAASAGVAGALIGLLFVAISVSAERFALATANAQVYRIRGRGADGVHQRAGGVVVRAGSRAKIGLAAVVVAVTGLMFITASMLSLIRLRQVRWGTARDALFLLGLAVTFVVQLVSGAEVLAKPDNPGDVNTIAIVVIVCCCASACAPPTTRRRSHDRDAASARDRLRSLNIPLDRAAGSMSGGQRTQLALALTLAGRVRRRDRDHRPGHRVPVPFRHRRLRGRPRL
jgi:hypothetical protein